MAPSQTSLRVPEVLKNLRNRNRRICDGRRRQRLSYFLLAAVHNNKYICEEIIKDMSVGGCRGSNTDDQLIVGETVVISIPERKMSLNGMMMWVRCKTAGFCFNLSSA